MKAVYLTGNRQVEVRDIPAPEAGRNQVVVKIKVSAICGSDLHTYSRIPGPGDEPCVCGHEPCGDIYAVGEGVTNLHPGQRAALYHYHGCGTCKYCAAGLMQHCQGRAGFGSVRVPGGDAEYMLVNAYNVLPLPEPLSYVDGAFVACIASTAYRALTKLKPGAQKKFCVYGLGPVGLTAVKLAKAMGAGYIIGVDPNDGRRGLALKAGADAALDSGPDLVKTIRELTGGGADITLETSGSIAAQRNAVESAAQFGEIAVVGIAGLYDKEGGVNLSGIIGKELSIYGSFVIALPQIHELLKLMVDKDIHFDDLVTHRFAIGEAAEAFALFDKGETGKVVFEFN